MTIISQDKKWIFNYDNTTSIGIDGDNTIKIISTAGKWNELGKYETEKRAKEILEDITKQKAIFELFRTAPSGGREQAELIERFTNNNIIFDTYEMPLE